MSMHLRAWRCRGIFLAGAVVREKRTGVAQSTEQTGNKFPNTRRLLPAPPFAKPTRARSQDTQVMQAPGQRTGLGMASSVGTVTIPSFQTGTQLRVTNHAVLEPSCAEGAEARPGL